MTGEEALSLGTISNSRQSCIVSLLVESTTASYEEFTLIHD